VSPFSGGIAKVKKDGKYGFVDSAGRLAIPCEFGSVRPPFSEGLVAVAKEGRWGYIDKSGSWAIRPHTDGAVRATPAD
jgi:hypothetical protein